MIARLGDEAVKLSVPMQVDLKFGRNWGDATHSWEELTGDASARTQAGSRAQTAPRPSPTQACCGRLRPKPEPARTPADRARGLGSPSLLQRLRPIATARISTTSVPAQSSIAFPAFDRERSDNDRSGRADRRAGAEEPQDLLPVPRRNKAEPAHLSRSLLLLRLPRLWRSHRLAGAGRGPRPQPRRRTSLTTGPAR